MTYIMRKLFGAFVSIVILANQATAMVPSTVADPAGAPAPTESTYTLQLNTKSTGALDVKSTTPTFNNVREHLIDAQYAKIEADAQAKQAQAKAKADADAKAKAEANAKQAQANTPTNPVVIVPSGDAWGQLRQCEAGGNYARNSGNGYYGAYQFDIGTWGGYGGYTRADLAPPAVQDEKARQTQSARGWYPWPACARKLGLI